MDIFLKLLGIGAFPIGISVILYIFDRRTALGRLNYKAKQAIYGVIFGLLAVLATEFGVDIGGAIINVRDSAPICAGLIFGGPAGIIAGIIGGVERWFSTLWGGGEYTRLACSVSTILAGFIAAGCRKFLFDNKKPSWIYGLAISMVTEVIHMLMIFLTNITDVHEAFSFVEYCSIPMIALNSVSVTLSLVFIALLGKRKPRGKRTLKNISQTFQGWLFACLVVGFLGTTVFSWTVQTQLSESNADNLIRLNIRDVVQDITDASDKNLLSIARGIASRIDAAGGMNSQQLKELSEEFDIVEIDVINENGFITASTVDEFLGFDMRTGPQSSAFLVLLDGTQTELVQSYQSTAYDPTLLRKYAGVALESGGFVQAAYDADRFQRDIGAQVVDVTKNRHIGESGFMIIADEDRRIVSNLHDKDEGSRENTQAILDISKVTLGKRFVSEVYGVKSFCICQYAEGYYILAVMPIEEAVFSRNVSVYVTVFMEFIIFGILFVLVYILIKKLVVDNIVRINGSLAEITEGNLDVVVDVRSNSEFASLSDDINSTVVTLKRYISEAEARIDKELEFARSIQHSALPSVFPPFPNRKEFDIYALMETAKEVGGDFYDFYFVGDNKLAFLIADVSGKGIPAAMFMMTAKTLLKGFAEAGSTVDEVFTRTNEKLCENNDAAMFVTAWMAVIDLKTGLVEFVNAGHNPPLIRHKNGEFEYLKSRAGFVLAGMEGLKYRKSELSLEAGDEVFLYTDGVTEATNAQTELYGEERLIAFVNTLRDYSADEVCAAVKADVDAFVGEAPQFDDITMVYFRYNGEK